jgi:hypothetical protein
VRVVNPDGQNSLKLRRNQTNVSQKEFSHPPMRVANPDGQNSLKLRRNQTNVSQKETNVLQSYIHSQVSANVLKFAHYLRLIT